MEDHLHRLTQLGSAVLITERWYKAAEREHASRSKACLEATDAILTGLILLTKTVDLTIPGTVLAAEWSEQALSIGRLCITAEETSSIHVLRISGELGAAITRAIGQRIPLEIARATNASIQKAAEGHDAIRDQMVQLMRQTNIEGGDQRKKFVELQRNFEFEQMQSEQCYADLIVGRNSAVLNEIEFSGKVIEDAIRLRKAARPAFEGMRQVFGLPKFSPEWLEAEEALFALQRGAFNETMASVVAILPALPKAGQS